MNTNIRELNLKSIQESKLNPRIAFPKKYIASLSLSMESVGLLEPILVRPIKDDLFEVVHGECRFEAAKLLKWKTIAAQISKLSDAEVMKIRLHENIFRKDLSPFEKGRYAKIAIEELMKRDKEPLDNFDNPAVRNKYSRVLASQWNVSFSSILNWVQLTLKVPEKYRAWVRTGPGRKQTRKGILSPYRAAALIRIGNQLKNKDIHNELFDMNAKEPFNDLQLRGLMDYAKKNPYATKEDLTKKRQSLSQEIELKTQIPIEIHRKLVNISEKDKVPVATLARNILVDHFFKS